MKELPLNLINAKSPYEVSYAAIIIENRNPLLKNVIDDFEQTTQVLTAVKP